MIELITGLPGHGKTLYALERYRKTKRPIYYHGIKELRLPWFEWAPSKWEELPSGALFIIDEAQFIFPLRGRGEPDQWIAQLATHRHKGIDFVLITQNPMLLDSFVRRLVDHHLHVVRKFGTRNATIHEYTTGVREEVSKSRGESIRHEWRYPSDVFALYKSAELHTVKARIPARVFVFAALIIGLPLGGWLWWNSSGLWRGKGDAPAAAGAGQAQGGGASRSTGSSSQQHLSAAEYVAQAQPRVPGLEYTAPIYDQVTQPKQAPYPSACVASATRCVCYSQQATHLDMPKELCLSIVRRGFFVAWEAPPPTPQASAERPLSDSRSGGPSILTGPSTREPVPPALGVASVLPKQGGTVPRYQYRE